MNVRKGNVLDTSFQVIAHQVNCGGVMGAGVARAIADKYDEVYEDYQDYCNTCSDALLGKCLLSKTNDGEKFIANLFGQYGYGTDSRQTKYDKLYQALIDLKQQMINNDLYTLSFPYKIGCGLAGGNWEVVKSLIAEVFDGTEIIYNFYDIN